MNSSPEIKIFPNPAFNIINIEFYLESSTNFDFDIITSTGVVSYSNGMNYFENGWNNFTINISSLPVGIYYCRIIGIEKISQIRFSVIM